MTFPGLQKGVLTGFSPVASPIAVTACYQDTGKFLKGMKEIQTLKAYCKPCLESCLFTKTYC
jgi:hypothetical protein